MEITFEFRVHWQVPTKLITRIQGFFFSKLHTHLMGLESTASPFTKNLEEKAHDESSLYSPSFINQNILIKAQRQHTKEQLTLFPFNCKCNFKFYSVHR